MVLVIGINLIDNRLFWCHVILLSRLSICVVRVTLQWLWYCFVYFDDQLASAASSFDSKGELEVILNDFIPLTHFEYENNCNFSMFEVLSWGLRYQVKTKLQILTLTHIFRSLCVTSNLTKLHKLFLVQKTYRKQQYVLQT